MAEGNSTMLGNIYSQLYQDLYTAWRNDNRGFEYWLDYYFHFRNFEWQRESKQRNYKRNKDIIYNSNSADRNNKKVGIEIKGIDDYNFYLDRNILKLEYEDKQGEYSYNSEVDKLRPFDFVTMEVNKEMKLTADIPNIIMDANFFIDKQGKLNLIYG